MLIHQTGRSFLTPLLNLSQMIVYYAYYAKHS